MDDAKEIIEAEDQVGLVVGEGEQGGGVGLEAAHLARQGAAGDDDQIVGVLVGQHGQGVVTDGAHGADVARGFEQGGGGGEKQLGRAVGEGENFELGGAVGGGVPGMVEGEGGGGVGFDAALLAATGAGGEDDDAVGVGIYCFGEGGVADGGGGEDVGGALGQILGDADLIGQVAAGFLPEAPGAKLGVEAGVDGELGGVELADQPKPYGLVDLFLLREPPAKNQNGLLDAQEELLQIAERTFKPFLLEQRTDEEVGVEQLDFGGVGAQRVKRGPSVTRK